MLKYLMKYDFKKILRFLVWFYIISLSVSIIARILGIWANIQLIKVISTVFSSITYSAVVTVLINTFIHIMLGFATSFFKDQSYLTHTLPVKKDQLILSKYITSLTVTFLSVLVCVLSLFILLYSHEFIQGLKFSLQAIVAGFNMSTEVFVIFMVLILFAQIFAVMSMGFTAIIKGYSYNHKRGIKGFLWFILYYAVCSVISILLIIVVSAITGNLQSLLSEQMSQGAFLTIICVGFVCYVVYAVFFYFLCKKEFKKGVNVD